MAIKVKAVIGSTSPTSFNRKLVEFMKERYADKLDIALVSINDVETYSVALETEIPANAKAFMEDVRDSEAVLFATPEYNFSIPGSLKNAVDWLSRSNGSISNKPGLVVGASMGVLGSVRAQVHLREILSNPNLAPILLPSNEVYIGSVHKKMDEAGNITDEGTVAFLDSVVDNFVTFYNKVKVLEEVR